MSHNLGDPRNLILFVGHCAKHTLGHLIVSGRNLVNIFGTPHEVKAQVARIDVFSGHAGRSELIGYVKSFSGSLRKITVIHGEESASLAFGQALRVLKPQAEVVLPQPGQIVGF